MFSLGLAVAFGAMFSFAVSDFLAKRVSAKLGSKRTTLIMFATGLVSLAIGAYFIGLTKINAYVLFFSVLSGAIDALAYLLLFKSLETEQVSNTISLTGIEYGLITLLAVFVLGEAVTSIMVIGLVGVFLGAFLVTTTKKFKLNVGYIPAILAFALFSFNYMFLVFAQQNSGGLFVPLIIRGVVAVSIMAIYLEAYPERGNRFKNTKLLGAGYGLLARNALVGVFGALGSILFLFLAQVNFIAIGSAIVTTEPALIVFLGYIFYRERFLKHQIIGFAMLILGTIVLSVV